MYHLYNQKPERSTLDVVVAQYSRLVPTAVLRYIIREWNTEGGVSKKSVWWSAWGTLPYGKSILKYSAEKIRYSCGLFGGGSGG